MDRSNFPLLRSLPRVFLDNVPADLDQNPIELPPKEFDKFRKVLRLNRGDQVAVLPGDGRIIRCSYEGKTVVPIETHNLNTQPEKEVILIQALPKMDKLEVIVRMATELGVHKFVLFPSERTVVRWDNKKLQDRINRLKTIARESAEVGFRATLPEIEYHDSLKSVLEKYPASLVLSEYENVEKTLSEASSIIVGPEGGWTSRELKLIGDRSVTLGPRVLRVETAAIAACSILLCEK